MKHDDKYDSASKFILNATPNTSALREIKERLAQPDISLTESITHHSCPKIKERH